jgi:hypothetical protein
MNDTDNENDFLRLMQLFYVVGDSIRSIGIDSDNRWLYEADVFSAKLVYHIGTLHYLSKGTPLPIFVEKDKGYVDHSSIAVLVRAAFETYLTFNYIYCDPSVTTNEKQFRHLVWRIGGLRDRQKFIIIRPENRPKIEAEKVLLDKLVSQLESATIYQGLGSKAQKAARSGDWRYRKYWPDLAEIAGFNIEVFRNVYSYLCSYAHSGGLSAIQIGQAIAISDQRRLTGVCLHFGMILMSHFILRFSDLFDEAKDAFEKSGELKDLAFKWETTWNEEGFLKPFSSDRLNS